MAPNPLPSLSPRRWTPPHRTPFPKRATVSPGAHARRFSMIFSIFLDLKHFPLISSLHVVPLDPSIIPNRSPSSPIVPRHPPLSFVVPHCPLSSHIVLPHA